MLSIARNTLGGTNNRRDQSAMLRTQKPPELVAAPIGDHSATGSDSPHFNNPEGNTLNFHMKIHRRISRLRGASFIADSRKPK
jgi:hypothetical protein